MSCVTPSKARSCCSRYLAARLRLSAPLQVKNLSARERIPGLLSSTIHVHRLPQLLSTIAAGKVSSVYETINYTYLIQKKKKRRHTGWIQTECPPEHREKQSKGGGGERKEEGERDRLHYSYRPSNWSPVGPYS